jgi:hypothetical protein
MTSFGAALLSIMMIATFVLAAGGLWTLFRRRETKRGLLMLGASAVILANVLIWTL